MRVVTHEAAGVEPAESLDQLVAEGARRMLAAALEAEVEAYVSTFTTEVDEHGRRLVVRNGHAESRRILTGAGSIEVRAPRVDDRRVDPTTPASGAGFARRSCPRGPGRAPRWPRCSRSCTCTA